jgi:hypothetical protein
MRQHGYDLRQQSLREHSMSLSRQMHTIELTVAAARHLGKSHHDHLGAKRTDMPDDGWYAAATDRRHDVSRCSWSLRAAPI